MLPRFVVITGLTQWKIGVGKSLATYGGRTDLAELKWVAKSWKAGQAFDALTHSSKSRFDFIDLKLSSVLTLMIKGPQGARILV